MKIHLKNRLLQFFILLCIIFNCTGVNAQQFDAKDIDGNWTRDDGMKISISGTAVFEEGSKAMVMNVGKSGWPASTEHYAYKYQKIKYVRGNTWKGINYRHRLETDARVEDGEAVFIMSDDRKSFKATGGYTYRKDR